MGLRSGLLGQVMTAPEVTPGTMVTVANAFPVRAAKMRRTIARIEDPSIIAGREILTSTQWATGLEKCGGSIETTLYNRGLEDLLGSTFGNVVKTGVGPYNRVWSIGDLSKDTFTCQVGKPGTAGVVHPTTFGGCAVTSAELKVMAGEFVTASFDIFAMSATVGTAKATATYPASMLGYKGITGVCTVGGVATKVKGFTAKVVNPLDENREYTSVATPDQALSNGLREITIDLDLEFVDMTHVNAYFAGSEVALSFALTGSGTDTATFAANVRYDGEEPDLDGPELLRQSIPMKVVANGTDAAAFTLTMVSAAA